MQTMIEIWGSMLALVWTVLAVLALPGLLRIPRLPDAVEKREEGPLISVILAARNEEDKIEQTLLSLLENNYVNFEIVAVDDRSDDCTGEIMEKVCQKSPRLTVIHVTDLPSGWLGKNYALYLGAQQARGKWLLFTDGDVWFASDALSRAVYYAEKHDADHLVIPPRMKLRGYWLMGLVAFFIFNLTLFFRPQNAINPRSQAHMGVGAFNMLRRDVYEAVGTHQALALRPDDDLRLGRLVKEKGFRQHFIPARHFAEVEWYPTLTEMAHGLEKNALAPFRYSIPLLLFGMLPLFLLYVSPFVAPFATEGGLRLIYLYCLGVMFALYVLTGVFTQLPVHHFLTLPVSVLLFIYMLVRAALLAWRRGGIHWRGTFYSLKELRKQR
ncbi:glycosyltransferase family 2 protein [Aneurinibacillus sp. REN35]|uniref:glycosyltransferase n=1 Tax=Aneurinibacillus sp. REN35 TaxID=3237286 RepID=UPI003528BFCF